jgi:hypothetical protein
MLRFPLCCVNRLRSSELRPVLLNQYGRSFSLLNEQNISFLPLATASESGSRFEAGDSDAACR